MADVQLRQMGRGPVWIGRIVLVTVIGIVAIIVINFASIQATIGSWFEKPVPTPRGQVKIYVSSTRIPAYSRVENHMVAGDFKNEAAIPPEVIRKEEDFMYRVAIVDIEPGVTFKEWMFAPKGTLPGLAAGIEPGCCAVTLNASDVEGVLNYLKVADYVALVAVWTDDSASGAPRRATLVSRKAKVLLPLQGRVVQSEGGGGGNPLVGHGGGGPRASVVQELTLSIAQADAIRLSEAQGKAKIRVVLLSGAAGGDSFDFRPTGTDVDSTALIELIKGDATSVQTVRPPEGGKEPKDE